MFENVEFLFEWYRASQVSADVRRASARVENVQGWED